MITALVGAGALTLLAAIVFRKLRLEAKKIAVRRLHTGITMVLAYHGDFDGYAESRQLLEAVSRYLDGRLPKEDVVPYYDAAIQAVGDELSGTLQGEIIKAAGRLAGIADD